MDLTGYDHHAIEAQARAVWEEHGIYRFDRDATGPVFSVDTPPPYVSAGNLHVGHAMSYSQPDFVVRFRRMRGERVFYPMGFDDNGLPTERYVERAHGVRAVDMPRAEFVELCLSETRRLAADYEQLWRRLGLSVDWSLRYSTIAPASQRVAQASFVTLYERGRIARVEDPILWCPECRTALAQADVEDLPRNGTLHRIAFTGPAGEPLLIATTRPELLPACVALYCHPDDERYRHLVGGTATVPLSGHEVPVRADVQVDPDFGTGMMMVCTFGDGEDVARWRRDGLELRLIVTEDGRLGDHADAGDLAGMPLPQARKAAVERLSETGRLHGSVSTKQTVGVHERCGTPVEFQVRPQWFLRVRDLRDTLRQRAGEMTWVPPFMRRRLEDWIDGLKWDWNLSRQRHYGTPFPVWFCRACGAPVLAPLDALPVDPLSDPPPVESCPLCGCTELLADPDVMDTWMTSSLSPQINAGWFPRPGSTPQEGAPLQAIAQTGDPSSEAELAPMSLRVQSYEIIRTWLFYTMVQSELHFGRLPWTAVMISGHGQNEQGRKLAKRDLEKATTADGFNRYVPDHAIDRYGADALRLWATKARVGSDLRFHEKDVRAGRKLAVKLFNVGRFVDLHLGDERGTPAMPPGDLTAVDRWMLSHLAETVDEVSAHLEAYDVMAAHQAAARFFWSVYCDRYLEMIKGRFLHAVEHDERERASARAGLWRSLRTILGLFAPFAPFVTEHLYQRFYRAYEAAPSLHVTTWPVADPEWRTDRRVMDQMATVLDHVRARRSALHLGGGARVAALVLHATTEEAADLAGRIAEPLRAAARAEKVLQAEATGESGVPGLAVNIIP
jgi:valyl-tRNA synthetase